MSTALYGITACEQLHVTGWILVDMKLKWEHKDHSNNLTAWLDDDIPSLLQTECFQEMLMIYRWKSMQTWWRLCSSEHKNVAKRKHPIVRKNFTSFSQLVWAFSEDNNLLCDVQVSDDPAIDWYPILNTFKICKHGVGVRQSCDWQGLLMRSRLLYHST